MGFFVPVFFSLSVPQTARTPSPMPPGPLPCPRHLAAGGAPGEIVHPLGSTISGNSCYALSYTSAGLGARRSSLLAGGEIIWHRPGLNMVAREPVRDQNCFLWCTTPQPSVKPGCI